MDTNLRQKFEAMLNNPLDFAYDKDQVLDLMQQVWDMDRWIRVEDGLPAKDGNYITLDQDGDVTMNLFFVGDFGFDTASYVIAYQPLPAAPGERRVEG